MCSSMTSSVQQLSSFLENRLVDNSKSVTNIQESLEAISVGMKTEQALSKQHVNLQGVTAALREKLQASDSALVETRAAAEGFQHRNQVLDQELLNVKARIQKLCSSHTQDPSLASLLHDLETQTTSSKRDIIEMQEKLTEKERKIDIRDEEIIKIRQNIDTLTGALNGAELVSSNLMKEKSVAESSAQSRYESMKNQLQKATEVDRAFLSEQHIATTIRAQSQVKAAEVRAELLEEQVVRLKAAVDNEVLYHRVSSGADS